jgi:methyl-accepting chemotaxis protein
MQREPAQRSQKDVASALQTFGQATDATWSIMQGELKRLLERRIDLNHKQTYTTLIISLGLAFFASIIGLIVARSIVHGVDRLAQSLMQLKDGSLSAAIPFVSNHDEIGTIARAIDEFRNSIVNHLCEMSESERTQAIKDAQKKALSLVGQRLEEKVATIASEIDRSSGDMARISSTI